MATSKIQTAQATAWQDLPSGDASGYDKISLKTALYSKVGQIVYLNLYNNELQITSGWKNIGKLPEGFRPTSLVSTSGSSRNSNGYEIQVQANGNVFINSNSNYTWVSLTFSFVVGGVIRSLLKALQSLAFRTERGWV